MLLHSTCRLLCFSVEYPSGSSPVGVFALATEAANSAVTAPLNPLMICAHPLAPRLDACSMLLVPTERCSFPFVLSIPRDFDRLFCNIGSVWRRQGVHEHVEGTYLLPRTLASLRDNARYNANGSWGLPQGKACCACAQAFWQVLWEH